VCWINKKIWYKNILSLLKYHHFHVGIFYFESPRRLTCNALNECDLLEHVSVWSTWCVLVTWPWSSFWLELTSGHKSSTLYSLAPVTVLYVEQSQTVSKCLKPADWDYCWWSQTWCVIGCLRLLHTQPCSISSLISQQVERKRDVTIAVRQSCNMVNWHLLWGFPVISAEMRPCQITVCECS